MTVFSHKLQNAILIKENFLHYLWKHKVFVIHLLQTSNNEDLQILRSGEHNLNSGPDFINAQIRIDGQLWAGNVEIHIRSSDWYLHHHEKDVNYDNVILHVVWENDIDIYRKHNAIIPTLQLKNIVSNKTIDQYQILFSKQLKWINCESLIHSVDKFTLDNWLEVLYFERLEQKSSLIYQLLQNSANDWETVLFRLLAKNFGLKVNGDAFLNLAKSLDFKIIRKEQGKLYRLEALLFGQAGLLQEEIEEPYYNKLKSEYRYLQAKYHLEPIFEGQFHFFRLRPNNFPTIRIAQFAMLYFLHKNLFIKILETNSLDKFYDLFETTTSSFWNRHYNFNSHSVKRLKKTSKPFIDLLLINTIIPIKFIYYKELGKIDEGSIIKIPLLIKSENNNIIKRFENLFTAKENMNLKIKNAFESQAFLQLKTSYCDKQRCLHCAVGNAILKK